MLYDDIYRLKLSHRHEVIHPTTIAQEQKRAMPAATSALLRCAQHAIEEKGDILENTKIMIGNRMIAAKTRCSATDAG